MNMKKTLEIMLELTCDNSKIMWTYDGDLTAMRLEKGTFGYYSDYDTIPTILDDLADSNHPYIDYIDEELIEVVLKDIYSYDFSPEQIDQVVRMIADYQQTEVLPWLM